MSSLVSIVGAGPGDPDLITDKAIERLQAADVVFHDKLSPDKLMETYCSDETIVRDVGKRKGKVGPSQDEINRMLVDASREHDRIVRLKGGDPFLFGRGGEETEYLAEHNVNFEIIPGVSSLTAVPASAGVPLTHRDHSSSVGVITGHFNRNAEDEQHDWEALARMETLVVMMGITRADHVASELIDAGRSPETPAAVIGWGATPRQESLVTSLEDLREGLDDTAPYLPGLIVIGDVVDCRQTLNWFENRPLFGRKILVTRPESQSNRLSDRLTEAGAETFSTPTIKIKPLESGLERLKEQFDELEDVDWLVFTSRNAVRIFFETLEASPYDLRQLGGLQTASIGPGTAERLQDYGLQSDVVPEKHRAEDLADSLLASMEDQSRIVLPRSADARSYLPETLSAQDHRVNEISIYESTPPDPGAQQRIKDLLSSQSADMITFTSSSTVDNLFDFLDETSAVNWLRQIESAAIGPITAGTLQDHGVTATVVPENYNLDDFVDAILDHFNSLDNREQRNTSEIDS